MGILGDLGQKGSRAGRAFGMMMTILVRPTKKEKDALNELFKEQLHVSDGWDKMVFKGGKFEGMDKLVTQLATATMGLTQQQRLNYLTTIFGTQNTARVIIPLINAEIDAIKHKTHIYEDSKYSVANAMDAWNKSFDLLKKSWKGVVGLLKETFEPIVLEVGRKVAEALDPFVRKAAVVLKHIREWVQQNPQIVDFGVKVAAIAAIALVAAGAFLTLGGTIMYLIGNIGVFVGGIAKVMTPFATLIGFVVALGTAVVNNTNGIRDSIQRFAGAVSLFMQRLIGDGKDFQTAWSGIWDFASGVVDAAAGAIALALNIISNWIGAITRNEALMGFLRGAIGLFIQFRAALTGLALAAGGLWAASKALGAFMALMKVLTGYSTVVAVIKSLYGAFVLLYTAIKAFGVGGALEYLFLVMGGGKLVAGFNAVKMAVLGLIPALYGAATAAWAAVAPLLPIIGIAVLIGAAIGLLALAWANNWGNIRGITEQVVGIITGLLTPLIVLVSNVVGAVGDAVNDMAMNFGDMGNEVHRIADQTGHDFQEVKDRIKQIMSETGDSFEEAKQKAELEFRGIPQAAKTAVKDTGDEFHNAKVLWASKAHTSAKAAADSGYQPMKDNIQKFRHAAIEAALAYAQGMKDREGQIKQAMKDINKGLKHEMTVGERIARLQGMLHGKALRDGLKSADPLVRAQAQATRQLILDQIRDIKNGAYNVGYRGGNALGDGLADGILKKLGRVSAAANQAAKVARDMFPGSEPKNPQSPLRGITKAFGFADVFAEGLVKGRGTVQSAMRSVLETSGTGGIQFDANVLGGDASGLSVTTSAQRTLRLELDLTSSDGSQDGATLEKLEKTLNNSDLIRSLEHMVTVR